MVEVSFGWVWPLLFTLSLVAANSSISQPHQQFVWWWTPYSVCFCRGFAWPGTLFRNSIHKVQTWLQLQSTTLNIEDEICVSTVIDSAKTLYRQAFHQGGHIVGRYRQMLQLQHQDYVLAPYLSALKIKNTSRRLVSRLRCGCHHDGLHVDTGQLKPVAQRVDREQRSCLVCASGTAEDEHHFIFDCPAYCSIRDSFTSIFWGPAPTLSSFFTLHEHRVIAKFLHECFAHRSMLLEISRVL